MCDLLAGYSEAQGLSKWFQVGAEVATKSVMTQPRGLSPVVINYLLTPLYRASAVVHHCDNL